MYFPSPYDVDEYQDQLVNYKYALNALAPVDYTAISYLCPTNAPFELACWQKRLPSPRCKSASHYARCVAHILCNRPCERPMTAPGVYADDITKRTVTHEIHTEDELFRLTKAKYGNQFLKRDIFHLPMDFDRGDVNKDNDCCFGSSTQRLVLPKLTRSVSRHAYEHHPVYEYEYETDYEVEYEPEYEYEYEIGPNGKLRIKLDSKGNKVLKLDKNGKPIPKTDEKGNVIYKLDLMGKPIPLVDKHGKIVFKKDATGKRIAKRDESGNVMFKTDEKGRKLTKIDPVSGEPIVRRDSNGMKVVKLDTFGNPIFQVTERGVDEDDKTPKYLQKAKSRRFKSKRSLSQEEYEFRDLRIKKSAQKQKEPHIKKHKSKRKVRKEDFDDDDDYPKPRRSRKRIEQDTKDKSFKTKRNKSDYNQYDESNSRRKKREKDKSFEANINKQKSKQKFRKDEYEDSKSARYRSNNKFDKQYDSRTNQKQRNKAKDREDSKLSRKYDRDRSYDSDTNQKYKTRSKHGRDEYDGIKSGRKYDKHHENDAKQYKVKKGFSKNDYDEDFKTNRRNYKSEREFSKNAKDSSNRRNDKPEREYRKNEKDTSNRRNDRSERELRKNENDWPNRRNDKSKRERPDPDYEKDWPNRRNDKSERKHPIKEKSWSKRRNDKSESELPNRGRDWGRSKDVDGKRSLSNRSRPEAKRNAKITESIYKNRRNDYSASTERKQDRSQSKRHYANETDLHKVKSGEFNRNKAGMMSKSPNPRSGSSPWKVTGKKQIDFGNDSKYYKSVGPKYMDKEDGGYSKYDKRNIVVNKSHGYSSRGIERRSKLSVRIKDDRRPTASGDAGKSSFEHSSPSPARHATSVVNADRLRRIQKSNLMLAEAGNKPSRYKVQRMVPDPKYFTSRYDFKKKYKTKQAKIKEKLSRILKNQPFKPLPSLKRSKVDEDETEGDELDEFGSVKNIKSKFGGEGDASNSFSDPQLNSCWHLARNLYRKQAVKVLAIPNPETVMNFVQERYSGREWVKGKAIATRYYPNGQTFCASYGNYSAQIFYPHGGLAVAISAPDPVNQVLVFRDPYDDFYFVEESILAEFDGMGKGTVLDSEGVVKLQYNIDGGFMLEEVEKLSKRWEWNPGGQRIILKLNRYLSLRVMDIEQIHLIFNGNKRGVRFNVGPTGLAIKLIGTNSSEIRGMPVPPCIADNYDCISGRFNTPPDRHFDNSRILKPACAKEIPTVYYHPASKYSNCNFQPSTTNSCDNLTQCQYNLLC